MDIHGLKYEPEPGTVYLAYRGSVSFGTQVPSGGLDDIDLMGFVIGGAEHYMGLKEWGSRGTKESKQGQLDIVNYELRKAFGLLLHGNPNILSMLWTLPEYRLLETSFSRKLLENRHLFVGKHVYESFAGYAAAQMHKMESRDPAELREYLAVTAEMKYRGIHPNQKGEGGPAPLKLTGEAVDASHWTDEKLIARMRSYHKKGENLGYMGDKRKSLVLEHHWDTKNGAHLIRLLRMCVEFLKTGELQVFRPDAAGLIDIKQGKWTLQAVKEHAEDLFRQAKEARDSSRLPEQPNRAEAEKLLIELIRDHLEYF